MRQLLSDIALIPDDHRRGKTFEWAVKWLLENAPETRNQFKKVWLWDDYPDRGGGDLGIDLVAETLQGTRWAIQAKCYGPDQSLTWGDLSTFYGDALGRTEIDQLLLVTTTDRISPNAKKKLDQSSKPSAIWAGADLLQFSIDSSLESLNEPAITEKYEPRPHQQEAIDDAVTHLEENERGQLLMACGTGKTLTGLWIREEMKAQRTVVFVPSIALLRQTWSSWNQHANEPFYSIAICSDEKATSRGKDHLVTSPSAAGLPPTTDPDAIANALDVPGPVVVFSTYQSSEVLETALKKAGHRFDLMIADEAHNTTSAGLTDFTRPLYDNHIPAKRRLFCTATPRIISRKGMKGDGEEIYDIHSMDNKDLYGEVAHRLMFSEAIADGLLNDYEVFVVGVDDPEIVGTIQERHYLDVNGTIIDGEELAAHVAIQRAMTERGTRRLISFHSRVKNAEQFSKNVPIVADWLRANGRSSVESVWSQAVSGEMPITDREKVLDRLETQEDDVHGIVSNARCLGEGVDVPTIDGIAFVEPKRSTIDIVQAVGRAIRRSKQKEKVSTIVLPVPIYATQDPEDTLKSSAFETVWRVLESLRAHDDVLSESLDVLRTQRGERGKAQIRLPKLIFDLPLAVGASFSDAITLKLLERTTESFWENLGYLKSYKAKHGDCLVPRRFRTKDGFTPSEGKDTVGLGSWVTHRRADYKNERLTKDRLDALNKLEFVWDADEEDFERGLSYLKAFKAHHGHCKVPGLFKTKDGFTPSEDDDAFKLGTWVSSRREERKDKKGRRKERISQERIALLDEFDFVWDIFEVRFQKGLGYLKAFKAHHGHCRVSVGFKTKDGFTPSEDDDAYPLGKYCHSRVNDHKYKRLSQERLDDLNALGFVWDANEWDFQKGLGYLKAFKAHHGHLLVSGTFKTKDGFTRSEDDDAYPLGTFVNNRRHRPGRLSKEHLRKLNELEFVWDALEERFQKGLGYLKAFKAHHGHCRVPTRFKTKDGFTPSEDDDAFGLGSWVGEKRFRYKNGKLRKTDVRELNEIGFSWKAR